MIAVHLRPAEGGERAVDVVQEEAVRIEPRLGLPLLDVVAGPRTLLGVGGERPVVHAQPGVLVLADDERPQREPVSRRRDLGLDREGTAHLEQLPLLAQPVLRGDRALRGSGVVRPPVHDPTAVGLCHGERGTDHA